MSKTDAFAQLREEIDEFASERDWHKFHSPKNLAMALSVEVAELVEIFQWLNQKESYSQENVNQSHLEEEIGDVMIYLSGLCMKFGMNPVEAALKKIAKNRLKYPADKVRGKADSSLLT